MECERAGNVHVCVFDCAGRVFVFQRISGDGATKGAAEINKYAAQGNMLALPLSGIVFGWRR